MVDKSMGAVIVKDFGRLIGILTERDLLKAMAARVHTSEARVRQWMTPDPITITPEVPLDEAAQIMLDNNFRHLPVMDGSAVIGYVSLRRVVGAQQSAAEPTEQQSVAKSARLTRPHVAARRRPPRSPAVDSRACPAARPPPLRPGAAPPAGTPQSRNRSGKPPSAASRSTVAGASSVPSAAASAASASGATCSLKRSAAGRQIAFIAPAAGRSGRRAPARARGRMRARSRRARARPAARPRAAASARRESGSAATSGSAYAIAVAPQVACRSPRELRCGT